MNTIPITEIQQALKDEPTFIVDGLPIFLDPTHTNISIDVSGGADSALTTYLILQELNRRQQDCTVHIISHHRCWKRKPWQGHIAKNVYDYIYENYRGNINMVRHTNFIPEGLESKSVEGTDRTRTGEMICVDEYREKLIHELNFNMAYNCTTMNPTIEFPSAMPGRNKEIVEVENIVDHSEPCANPLMYINKAWVIKQYKDYDILDLLYVTRSCECYLDDDEHWDGKRPDDCGECFWCYERHWAMDENKVPYV